MCVCFICCVTAALLFAVAEPAKAGQNQPIEALHLQGAAAGKRMVAETRLRDALGRAFVALGLNGNKRGLRIDARLERRGRSERRKKKAHKYRLVVSARFGASPEEAAEASLLLRNRRLSPTDVQVVADRLAREIADRFEGGAAVSTVDEPEEPDTEEEGWEELSETPSFFRALDIESRGELGLESRAFTRGGVGHMANVSGVGRMVIGAKWSPFRAQVRAFLRHDAFDRKRSAMFPEEAWLEFKKDLLRIRLGYRVLNWSATEAFSPADIINSQYRDGDLHRPQKLGELMSAIRIKFLKGNIEGYLMPRFAAPILPSSDSRFRIFPQGTVHGDTKVLDRRGRLTGSHSHPQFGARAQQSFWNADLGVHIVQHVDRSLPLVLVDPANPSGSLAVVYQYVTEVGGTFRQVVGSMVYKVEASHRRFTMPNDDMLSGVVPERDHTLAALGIEWGFGIGGGESTFFFEYQRAIGLETESPSVPLFQHDVFLGHRHDFSDESGQALTVSFIVDVDQPRRVFASSEFSRRVGETWTVQLGYRIISYPPANPDRPVGPEFLHNADHAYLNLTRFF